MAALKFMPKVNKSGYWVMSLKDGSLKTYACANLQGLKDLIYHLTGKEYETLPKDTRGLPLLGNVGITIAYPLHIWE